MDNLLEEEKDKVTLIKNVLDSIKSYLNYDRFLQELKVREDKERNVDLESYSPYVRTLMEKGATLKEALGK